MEGVFQDIRFAVRKLVRQPGFTIAALLTLALGIGANALLFTLVNAVLLRAPAGVTSPEQTVALYTADFSSGNLGTSSYADVQDFATARDVFSGVTAYAPTVVASGSKDAPVRAGAELVSDNYFSVAGVSLRGRSFTAAEAKTGAPVVVISEDYWKKQLGAAPDVIGKTIQLNASPVTVIGIALGGFHGSIRGFATDVWMSFQAGKQLHAGDIDLISRGDRSVYVTARMHPGVKITLAQRRMAMMAAQLYKANPENWATVKGTGRPITVVSERASRIPAPFRSQAYIFTGMLTVIVALVLMICCANVAGLMIARATSLTREMGIRISIGATRARIARLLLVESVVLSAGAAALGLLGTVWLADIVSNLLTRVPVPIALDLRPDSHVLLFTSAIALFSATLFGSVPAFRASRADPTLVIKTTNPQFVLGRRHFSFRSVLVAVQVGASVVLLITALLFLRSMRTALHADLGFRINDLAVMTVDPEPGYNPDDAESSRVALAAADALRNAHGVKDVSFAASAPFTDTNRRGMQVEGYAPARGEDMEFHMQSVGPTYLTTLGIPLVAGRDLSAQDRKGALPVVVVNESFASRFWKGKDAVGRRISFDGGEHFVTVIGVAHDAHLLDVGNGEITPYVFVPELQDGWRGTTLLVRADGLDATRLAALKSQVQSSVPRWTVRDERTMAKQAESSIMPQRVASIVLTVFGTLALFLSAVGLYGVIAYSVAQRTHEFGIRFALGASTRDVLRLTLGQGFRVILGGALVGMVLTAVVARLLGGLLLGLSPLDPVSFIAAPALLVMMGMLATFLPARRAARLDPLKALRAE